MFRELISVFRSDDPLARLGTAFSQMLAEGRLLTVKAGGHFFEGELTDEDDVALHEEDRKVNDLHSRIRKEVLAHLTLGLAAHRVPYAVLIMSLADDAEQIGDHALALAALRRDLSAQLPTDDAVVADLREIRRRVEHAFTEVDEVFAGGEAVRAQELIDACRNTRSHAEELVPRVAGGDYAPPEATALALAARHYARIASHLTLILAGVVLPLHELGFYDEDQLTQLLQQRDDDGLSE